MEVRSSSPTRSPVPSVEIAFAARPYQRGLVRDFTPKERGGRGLRNGVCIWHRKAGKDRVATFIESALAFERVGLYWHALPKYEDARKVIWDAITPDGKRLIDINFPREIVKRRLDHEMKLELMNGSIWQPVGADNFNNLVGAFPVHVTWSEYALMNPQARQYIRPALAMNSGSELFITTPRGYNHAHDIYQHAKGRDDWHCSLLSWRDTGVLSEAMLEQERATMPEELFRQEYECDFSAANIGSILGRYVEQAEKEGRINDSVEAEGPVEISSDIGFRDTACWWFWEPRPDGFALVDYDEDSGLDASEWIPRLRERALERGYKIRKIWLPQDAKAKTFQTRHSAVEQFLEAFGVERMDIVPASKKPDRINAARMVMPRCHFHRTRCKQGLAGLRSWSFRYDEERKTFSKDPDHDWASHPGDGFSYGAQIMRERTVADKPRTGLDARREAASRPLTFDDVHRLHDERTGSRRARV